MLTLIICSKFPKTSEDLLQNISETVGCEYEIVHIDNSQGQYSIFQAYNEGVRLSKGDYLCFMHEDLHFHSDNWGSKVEYYLKDTKIGLLGVAGVPAVPMKGDARMGGLNWGCHLDRYYTLEKHPRSSLERKVAPITGKLRETAVIDGLWFCMPKSIFSHVRFDEDTYNGFHLYDFDISMQVQMTGKKVMLCDDVIVEHDSIGVFNQSFSDSLDAFCNKWKKKLPLTRNGVELSDEELDRFTENAVKRLKARIYKDKLLVNIRNKFKTEDNPSFSEDEKKVIIRSIQVYWRTRFQNAGSAAESTRIVMEYLREKGNPFSLTLNIVGKYFYYGLMRKNSRV